MRWGALAALVMMVAAASCDLEIPPNGDRDGDLHRDVVDNCPLVPNPDQSDFDGDGIGDACDDCTDGGDEDVDGDGIPDGCDGCIAGPDDIDNDGIPDNCDPCVRVNDDIAPGVDVDNDGIEDACDTCVARDPSLDSDRDGIPDECDPCPLGPPHDEDGDGIHDACDSCVVVKNPGQENTLEMNTPGQGLVDKTGDACDEDPAANFELYDVFANASHPGWYQQGAGWAIANDRLSYSGNYPYVSYRLFGQAGSTFRVSTNMRIHGLHMGSRVGLLVASTQEQPANQRVECEVRAVGGFVGTELRVATYVENAQVEEAVVPYNPSIGQTFTLQLQVEDGKNATCSVGGLKIGTLLTDSDVQWYPGLFARTIMTEHYDFDFFDIITR